MEDRKDIDAWADAFLDQHRTAPPPTPKEPVAIEDLPPAIRLMVRLSGQEPDPEMLERLRRNQERHARLARVQGTIMLVGIGLMCAFGYAFLSGF